MFEIIITTPEVLLSIVVLSIVLYGINLPTLKISIGVLLIMVIMISDIEYFQPLWLWDSTNGLLMTNCWIIISKF